MCVAVPGVILSIGAEGGAVVDFGGVRRTVSLALLEDAREGDHVIVHAGFALQRINAQEAQATLALFRELLDEPDP